MSESSPIVEVHELRRHYGAAGQVRALDGVDLAFGQGERVALIGPSGSGKSTLLHLIGGLDRQTSGSIVVAGSDLARLDDAHLSRLRGEAIGFVFQFFNLLPSLDALENVALPLRLRRVARREALDRAEAALSQVGLADRLTHRPDELSGGQKQRVALARALVGRPRILLADEPTGNLDTRTGEEILALLDRTAHETGLTLIVVTHDASIASLFERRVTLRDGKVVADERAIA